MSPADELAHYLEGAGAGVLGAQSGWALAVGTEPDKPDTVITLYDTVGNVPLVDIDLTDCGVMLRARSSARSSAHAYRDAYAAALFAINELTKPEIIFGDVYQYIGVYLQTDLQCIGRDDNDRFIFTANFRIQRQPVEA